MTPHQQKRYERDLRLWEFRKKNPDLLLDEIAEVFNLAAARSVSHILTRMENHLVHGQPYVKPRDASKHFKRTGGPYIRPERINIRNVQNDVAYLAELGVRF